MRDGLQVEEVFVPTEDKVALVNVLLAHAEMPTTQIHSAHAGRVRRAGEDTKAGHRQLSAEIAKLMATPAFKQKAVDWARRRITSVRSS
jgi:hypothetical protein